MITVIDRAPEPGQSQGLPLLPDISYSELALALLGAFCLGFSKTGFPGLAIVNVLIIADLFGAKASVGIVLPLLIVCDIIVFPLFRKFATWRDILPLLPWCLAGIVIGWQLLGNINDLTARRSIGGVILLMMLLQIVRKYSAAFLSQLHDSVSFRLGTGLAIGISTMIANAAGPVYSIFALVKKMPKDEFLGIGARLFLLINILKIPFNTNLDIINPESLTIDLMLLPGILGGIFLGRRLIAKVPQSVFEIFLYAFSVIAGVRMLFF